jgi:UDP-N-acetyl-D-mannosaminuronic acid dehydrogenase
MKKVCMVGLGYIGLPTAILAAQSGLSVVGIDIDPKRVKSINAMVSPIEEPEVEKRLGIVVANGCLKAQTHYETADYYIIAVPTPFTEDKKADLSFVFEAARSIAAVLKKGDTVILESTVPVGTTKLLTEFLAHEAKLTSGLDFFVAHCPERVLPGNIFHELRVNDRVIGGIDRGSTRHVATFYKNFVSGDLYLTTAEAAEMTKLVENSYRDVNVAISHQVASMAYEVGLDPYEIIELANKHPRVNLLKPTCGVGGHCLAVDPWFLVETFPKQTVLFKTAREINDAKPFEVVKRIESKVQDWKKIHEKETCNILVLGLTYKANVDDIRESPALRIAKELVGKKDFDIMVCDPHVETSRLESVLANCKTDLVQGLEKADLIVCLVAHDEFKVIDKKIIAHKKILDFCGIFHLTRKHSCDQEQFFWPASGTDVFECDDIASYKLHEFTTLKEREKN